MIAGRIKNPLATPFELWHRFARSSLMPQPESFAKCACQHCGGHIEFPLRGAGQKICCPHCDKPTLLNPSQNARVEIGGAAARKRIFNTLAVAAAVALVAGGGAYYYFGFSQQQNTAATQSHPSQTSNAVPVPPPKPQPPPDPWHGLMPGKVALEKAGDGDLVVAVGAITNDTKRQRFGVTVQLDVLDGKHRKIGSATDYTEVIEPGKEWKFRAMVTDKAAKAAKLVNIKEQ